MKKIVFYLSEIPFVLAILITRVKQMNLDPVVWIVFAILLVGLSISLRGLL